MNVNKIIYWAATGIIAAMMLFSAYAYFTSPDMKAAFPHLGFPDFFRVELGTAKILGAIVLLLPMAPAALKRFAYSGFAITFVSAAIAHSQVGDPTSAVITPLVMLCILAASYIYYGKQNVVA